jgi:hypothetical protein
LGNFHQTVSPNLLFVFVSTHDQRQRQRLKKGNKNIRLDMLQKSRYGFSGEEGQGIKKDTPLKASRPVPNSYSDKMFVCLPLYINQNILTQVSQKSGHFLRNCNYWGQVSMRAFFPHSYLCSGPYLNEGRRACK